MTRNLKLKVMKFAEQNLMFRKNDNNSKVVLLVKFIEIQCDPLKGYNSEFPVEARTDPLLMVIGQNQK